MAGRKMRSTEPSGEENKDRTEGLPVFHQQGRRIRTALPCIPVRPYVSSMETSLFSFSWRVFCSLSCGGWIRASLGDSINGRRGRRSKPEPSQGLHSRYYPPSPPVLFEPKKRATAAGSKSPSLSSPPSAKDLILCGNVLVVRAPRLSPQTLVEAIALRHGLNIGFRSFPTPGTGSVRHRRRILLSSRRDESGTDASKQSMGNFFHATGAMAAFGLVNKTTMPPGFQIPFPMVRSARYQHVDCRRRYRRHYQDSASRELTRQQQRPSRRV
jgi:hypothetical protein